MAPAGSGAGIGDLRAGDAAAAGRAAPSGLAVKCSPPPAEAAPRCPLLRPVPCEVVGELVKQLSEIERGADQGTGKLGHFALHWLLQGIQRSFSHNLPHTRQAVGGDGSSTLPILMASMR